MLRQIIAFTIIGLLISGLAFAKPDKGEKKDEKIADTSSPKKAALDDETRKKVEASIEKGIQYLFKIQEKDGSWHKHIGITSIIIKGIMETPFAEKYKKSDNIKKAIKFILSNVRKDGGIYVSEMPNYNTCIAIMALDSLKDKKYQKYLANAQNFLLKLQNREEAGFNKEDEGYGGIGYGSTMRADLSNLQMALEALAIKVEGVDESKKREAFKRAIVFLEKVQQKDGGAGYRPDDPDNPAGVTRDPVTNEITGLRSYGSMTYAMFKSYIYAGLKPDDKRVKAALEWIKRHYTVEENPNVGQQGLYYYFHTFAKALSSFKQDVIIDKDGKEHNWRMDLAKKLLAEQAEDGSWSNSRDRWMEGDTALVTGYSLICLGYITKD